MAQSNLMTNERASELLSMKKIFKERPGIPLRLDINDKDGKHDIRLISENGMEEFSLLIMRSNKRIAKITFHHMDRISNVCLFRLDINGAPHTNPKSPNEFVPDNLCRFKGMKLRGSHVHIFVEGYGSELKWAVPLEYSEFSNFTHIEEIEASIQEIVDKVCETINLNEKIIYDQLLDYGQ